MSEPERRTPAGRGSRRTPLVVTHFDIPSEVAAEVDSASMFSPARCLTCRLVFDLGHVTVTQRYLDCSVWRCPGCGTHHDDRPGRWPGERNGYAELPRGKEGRLHGSR